MVTWFFSKKKKSLLAKEKDDFVSLSSHELRSPLSIIKWYTEILLDEDAGPLTGDQKKYLSIIETSNQRAIDLVRSLLNVSRLDLDTFSVSPEKVSIPAILSEGLDTFLGKINEKHLNVVTEEIKGSFEVSVDKHLMAMVLKAIIYNAITFTKDGGTITLSVRQSTPLEERRAILLEESIIVEVRDTGIGIPAADQSKIFSKMFRASNVKESEASGSGLGLYIAKTIMDYANGSISFTSEEGRGSTFLVSIPLSGMKEKKGKTALD